MSTGCKYDDARTILHTYEAHLTLPDHLSHPFYITSAFPYASIPHRSNAEFMSMILAPILRTTADWAASARRLLLAVLLGPLLRHHFLCILLRLELFGFSLGRPFTITSGSDFITCVDGNHESTDVAIQSAAVELWMDYLSRLTKQVHRRSRNMWFRFKGIRNVKRYAHTYCCTHGCEMFTRGAPDASRRVSGAPRCVLGAPRRSLGRAGMRTPNPPDASSTPTPALPPSNYCEFSPLKRNSAILFFILRIVI